MPDTQYRSAQGWGALEQQLLDKLEEAAITKEDLRIARQCLRELKQTAAQLGTEWKVKPFGSLCNGFAIRGSDLDAACCREAGEHDASMSPSEMQSRLRPLVEAHNKFQVIEVIEAARVPIMKVRFDQLLDVDISFQNTEPLPNTQMLRACAQLNPCVRDLGVMVKLWAKAAGVCGASNGHLSAYSLTLMAIYFLQVEPSLRMPVLSTSLFNGDSGVPPEANIPWVCTLPRAELLYRFFCFFTNDFQWGTEVVSIRCGRRATSDHPAYAQLRGRFDTRLHLEDPFLLDRNLHCVLRTMQEYTLYSKLLEAAQTMQCGKLPMGLGAGTETAELHLGTLLPPPPLGGQHSGGAGGAPSGDPQESERATKGRQAAPAPQPGLRGADARRGASAPPPPSRKGNRQELPKGSPSPEDVPVTLLQGMWSL